MPAKKERCLVLGAGHRTQQDLRVGASDAEADAMGPNFSDNFEDVWTIDLNPAAKPKILWDLTHFPWPVPSEAFDEVHAYEVLEHLTDQGDYKAFFQLWREIWRTLKPEGLVCGSTPWWESVWAWQDPGHKMCYSQQIFTYLSQAEYDRQLGVTSMTDYRSEWPKPYDFRWVKGWQRDPDPKNSGFSFIIKKEGKLENKD